LRAGSCKSYAGLNAVFQSGVANRNVTSILTNVLVCRKINRDKASGKYDKYVGYGDDRDPSFKLVL
jgi:hypothetical protein